MSRNSTGNRFESSREVRDRLVGQTIRGVIARPGRAGEPPVVMMLQFEDGTAIEFVSPRSDRVLRDAVRSGGRRRAGEADCGGPDQLALAAM
jgi:hypothetical protein